MLFIIYACLHLPAMACLWDSDTLAQEAEGKLDVVLTSVGWFDRHPPLYYEMRLSRVSAAIRQEPGRLEHYDDAAVACDRLGRQDEAISWMEQKKKIMDSLPPAQLGAHPYRYLANLGTFHAHRWVRSKDRGKNFADLDTAIRLVSEAIEINPAAHFNREPGQLLVLEWLRDGFRAPAELGKKSDSLQPLFISSDKRSGDRSRFDLTQSMCGLIQLGAAWESIDVYAWLVYSLGRRGGLNEQSNPSLALLPAMRCADLVLTARRRPLHPNSSFHAFCTWSDEQLAQMKEPEKLPSGYAQGFVMMLCGRPGHGESADDIVAFYQEARQAADKRHKAKTAYALAKLQRGEHPDTHPEFWGGWSEPSVPRLPASTLTEYLFGSSIDGWLKSHPKAQSWALVCLGGLSVMLLVHRLRRLRLSNLTPPR